MTSLNIGAVLPDKKLMGPKATAGPCPSCKAAPEARVTEGSFGTNDSRVLCGNCGYEFKETA